MQYSANWIPAKVQCNISFLPAKVQCVIFFLPDLFFLFFFCNVKCLCKVWAKFDTYECYPPYQQGRENTQAISCYNVSLQSRWPRHNGVQYHNATKWICHHFTKAPAAVCDKSHLAVLKAWRPWPEARNNSEKIQYEVIITPCDTHIISTWDTNTSCWSGRLTNWSLVYIML